MAVNKENYNRINDELKARKVTLVAVSKTKPVEDILELYQLGHRDFGENYVQELTEKAAQLPGDIRWHFIGHLQTNKVKFIIPFVQLIQGVDSLKLLKEINKQAAKENRVVDCLLQVHIAQEETKFGLDEKELDEVLGSLRDYPHVKVAGLMGMASFTEDLNKVKEEFRYLAALFEKAKKINPGITILSMGMSGDYECAIEQGSNMVRIGSLLFGAREAK
ncbi:MAG TPA: YggS family pyridoxal phosphate-dependent enzyme [Chitinophagaceae bacterium]|nr:YggS family pyridoxal phosphate-dependent enzyme [Chitinophagaceae bacterium]